MLSGVTTLTMLLTCVTDVHALRVTKSFKYDHNTVTGQDSNYHDYEYVDIPLHMTVQKASKINAGSGWNYIRYQVIYYYGSNENIYY